MGRHRRPSEDESPDTADAPRSAAELLREAAHQRAAAHTRPGPPGAAAPRLPASPGPSLPTPAGTGQQASGYRAGRPVAEPPDPPAGPRRPVPPAGPDPRTSGYRPWPDGRPAAPRWPHPETRPDTPPPRPDPHGFRRGSGHTGPGRSLPPREPDRGPGVPPWGDEESTGGRSRPVRGPAGSGEHTRPPLAGLTEERSGAVQRPTRPGREMVLASPGRSAGPDRRPPRPEPTGHDLVPIRATLPAVNTVEPDPDLLDRPEEDRPEPARSLGHAWMAFVGQVLAAAVSGLLVWLGFRSLWQRWPYGAAGAAAAVLVAMLLGGHLLHRRRHPDEPPDMITVGVLMIVGLVLTISPAAFVLRPL